MPTDGERTTSKLKMRCGTITDYPAKRLLDIVLATTAIVLLTPLMLLICIAVILESGPPVLFVQDRLGLHGRVFRIIKFRTMKQGSDGTTPVNEDGSLKTSEHDPRITLIGRWLRRFSLDELPQLFNVLRGEMSLVGPRPDLPFHEQFYDSTERNKLCVRPGITGLAQVSGRNEIPWKQRLAYDVDYAKNQSLCLDLKILLLTVWRVAWSKGIYQHQHENDQDRSVSP